MTDKLNILHHDEAQLLAYGETQMSGPYLKIRLKDPDYLKAFRGMEKNTILHVTIATGDISAVPENQTAPDKKGPHGDYARRLRLNGFHRAPKVIEALGTDKQYLKWLRSQPCIVCGEITADMETGNGANDPAHVRRASNSGTGYKPEYHAVPLCHPHHVMQHNHGEGQIYQAAKLLGRVTQPESDTRPERYWLDGHAANHLHKWAWEKLREALGVASMSHASPEMVREWAEAHDVANILPKDEA